MSIIQDKLGNDFLRSNGGMDSNFGPGMIMFSHLPPVASFTRLVPQEMILKKERDSPDCIAGSLNGGVGDYVHALDIKQEKVSEHDYRLPLYPGGLGKSTELLELTVNNNQNLLMHELNMANLPGQLGKEPAGRKGRRSNGDGPEGRPRKKRSEKQSMLLDADGGSLSPGSKPHICEHCNAAFRSSYHLRRHVLIHTGERPFRCSQCNMSFIQKYLLQRHEKIHSGEKPFSCDQCNMRFIQKYHMERHKRTHSGEKPYRCETCQQYFSRTDRLLKHKRTCGELLRKGLDPSMADMSGYEVTQGHAGRKRGRSKNPGEGGARKKKKADGVTPHVSGAYSIQDYTADNQTLASSTEPGPSMQQHGRSPKMAFKKAHRKGVDKGSKEDLLDQGVDHGLGLMQANAAKVGGTTSSNYDDAMQFLKKRRYLNASHNVTTPVGGGEYDISLLSSHPSVIHGAVSAVMDGDAPLCLDKSVIPDEVLQSLLDHYSQKADGSHHDIHFDIGDQHVELHPPDTPSPSGDKSVLMNEYSRFLLQALERTSHTGGFPLGPSGPASSGAFVAAQAASALYSDKNVYAASPLECGFGPSSTSPKSHFAMLASSSPQHVFHLSGLDQQLTPSQELSEQMEKQHSSTPPSAYQISPSDLSSHKDRAKTAVFPHTSAKEAYQIENFAQAFGAQFKSEERGLSYGADSGVDVDHRIRTSVSVSEFSGYSSLLSDVSEPASSASKTSTSQSFR
ncbi:zinc finger protein 281-like [Nerophis ophidion]|uniref:zinc finger protein 281-like n=1 Tax=Nerophis ophidion TaxID=159077 RepID=UPI002AE00073|nr:zinc finger protein 281-like [Nerophis ophidion]